MDEPNGSPAETQPNADPRIAELEAKYNELSRRYAASSEEGKRLAQQIQYFQQTQAASQANRPPWEQKLEESAIPIDALNQLIDARAGQLVQQRFEPIQRGIQARQTAIGRHKNFAKWEPEMGEMINSDPDFRETYNRVFEVDPSAAFDLAYYRLGETRRKEHRNGNQVADEADLSEAQIPSQRSGDSRRVPTGNDAAVAEAREAYRQNPNRTTLNAFANARLRSVIPDSHLNQ